MNLNEQFSEILLPPYTYHHELYNYKPSGIIKIPRMVMNSRFHEYYFDETNTRTIYNENDGLDAAELAGRLDLIESLVDDNVNFFLANLLNIEQLLITHLEKYGYESESDKKLLVTVNKGDILPKLTDRASYLFDIQKLYKNYQLGCPYVDDISDKRTALELLVDSNLGNEIHQKFEAVAGLIDSTAILSVKYLVFQMIRFEIGLDDSTIYTSLMEKSNGPGNPKFTRRLSNEKFFEILNVAREMLKENPEEFNPRKGAIVSLRLLQEIEDKFNVPSSTFRRYLDEHGIILRDNI